MSKSAAKLGEFNSRYRAALIAFFTRRLRNPSEAEDLTQDVFVRMAGSKDVEIRNSDAYVFQTASNILRDRIRREGARSTFRRDMEGLEGAAFETLDPNRAINPSALQASRFVQLPDKGGYSMVNLHEYFDVAQYPANPRRCALERFNERRVVVGLDFERAGPAVANIDDASIFSRPLYYAVAARRQPLEMDAG